MVYTVQKRRKKVYIAHPFRDNPPGNFNKVGKICRDIIRGQPNIIPVSPLHNFCYLPPEEDIIDYCLELLATCDEVWFYGDWQNSSGCRQEFMTAVNLNIPTVDKNIYQMEVGHD